MRVTKHKATAVQWIAAIVLAFSAAGCAGHSEAKTESKPKSAANPMEIKPGEDLLKQLSIGDVRMADVAATLRVAGRVEADETRMARVSAPVTGRIVELEIAEGQRVRRGDVLATIHSTDLAAAQSALLKASSQYLLADRAVARAKQLLDAGVIGEAELQRRQADLQQASAELSSSRNQLSVLGMSEEAIGKLETSRTVNSVTYIVSSIDGTVLERKVTIGQVVEAAETTFIIADLSNVWLVADIPEQSSGAIRVGKHVEAEVPAVPGHTVTGELSFVSAVVNPETRTIRTRMDLKNPERLYKPAMLATITMLDAVERRRAVPLSAVVREENDDYVFVQTQPDTFVLRRAKLGMEYRDVRVIEDGVRPGEKIVLDGAFHLNNERKRRMLQGE